MHNSFFKKIKVTYVRTLILCGVAAGLLLPSKVDFERTGENLFDVYVNGQLVGQSPDRETPAVLLVEARKELAKQADGLLYMEPVMELKGQEVLFGKISDEDTIRSGMLQALSGTEMEVCDRAYTVKIKDFTVNLSNLEDVQKLLQAAVAKYDSTGTYRVEMMQDTQRDLNVLTTRVFSEVQSKKQEAEQLQLEEAVAGRPEAGINAACTEILSDIVVAGNKDLSDYNYGLINMNFGDKVEVVESHMPDSLLEPLDQAIEEVTKDQETNQIYEVVSGDTLGEIAETHNMSLEDLVAINETLETENSMIRVGDELIISVPEPELSVERQEELYYEEDYDADVIYIPNDEWYTTQTQTLQQPSSGHRRVVALVSYRNDSVMNRDIIMEDVILEAVPKIVERGTKIPPTYIRPLSGGRLSSGFGGRKAPKKGASTNHKGLDFATPTGTAIMASCGGVVTKAGWSSGYGYLVCISHPDGRETRYGHLSKILVSAGQHVSQGQKIALSGNTGNSTGPHLHFEIRINGAAVNPLKYLS